MFPMDFDKLTREAFALVATDRNKWNPSGELGPEAAAFLATDCGIPMVLFVEWPAGGDVRADMYVPNRSRRGGASQQNSLWQCIRVADTRYVTLLYPLGETGGHLVAATQQRNLDAFYESLAAKAEAMGDLGDTRLPPEFLRAMLDSSDE